jgi:hypothetical protein
MFKFKLKNNAQSLIEVMIAIGITVMALVAILSMVLSTLVTSGQVAERTVAVFLAREGIEMTKNIRDSKWLDPAQIWPYELINDNYIVAYDIRTEPSNNRLIFADSSEISSCGNCQLYLTDSDRYVHQDTGYPGTLTPTNFRRMIKILPGDNLGAVCNNNCEKKIEATVYWTERGRSHQVKIEERLTDWR